MKRIVFLFFLLIVSFQINAQIESGDLKFTPESGKYIISGWVKESHSNQVVKYNSFIRIKFENFSSTLSTPNLDFFTVGNIIDGWQRIVGVFEIPSLNLAENPNLKIELHCNNASGGDCYYDDIRFYPFNGNMKSFVYDEETQRLMAELDENNYATFYEYDLEGGLIRVKKETERGVYTIQETRSNNPKR